jgi:transcriptional regulator with XRE-family HTH domain
MQRLVAEKNLRDKSNISLKDFLEALDIEASKFFEHRGSKASALEDSVEIAKALGVTVEYLITGETDKPDFGQVVRQLENIIEELKKL